VVYKLELFYTLYKFKKLEIEVDSTSFKFAFFTFGTWRQLIRILVKNKIFTTIKANIPSSARSLTALE